jgi:L-threonylcarbamoyladenylate synthase
MNAAAHVTPQQIAHAAQALRAGELVAFPTETVYGLGADAGNAAALRRVFELKGRPSTHPLIVHLASSALLPDWASAIPASAQRLAERFWPGPLTLVLARAARVLPLVSGGQDTVALRVPAHPLAQQLLAAFGGGIAAPSANRHGRLSPTSAAHVRAEFGDELRIVLDGGAAALGLESTIVACLGQRVLLLRPGLITRSQLQQVVGPIALPSGGDAPRAPGGLAAHYAPRTPLSIVAPGSIDALAAQWAARAVAVGVLARQPARERLPLVSWIDAGEEPERYARDLYAHLRSLDTSGAARLLVQELPPGERWEAIRDRLWRAAAAHLSAPALESSR